MTAHKNLMLSGFKHKEINRFVSLSEAVRYLKEEYNIEAHTTSLSKACKGKIKTAYKFKWKFDVKKQEETLARDVVDYIVYNDLPVILYSNFTDTELDQEGIYQWLEMNS